MALDIAQIGTFIGTVGFPIGAYLLMWKARREDVIRNAEREKEYMGYLQENTKVLQELTTTLRERLG